MITILSFILGIILGLLIAIGRVSKRKILNRRLSVFIELIRGTPLLVQVVYTYYVFPLLVDITLKLLGADIRFKLSLIDVGAIALGINYRCYLSEVIKDAIESIDHGQIEAALVPILYKKSRITYAFGFFVKMTQREYKSLFCMLI